MATGPAERTTAERTTAELLRDGFRWFADDLEVRSAEAGEPALSPGASMVMSYLDDEPISPSRLARRMQVSRQRIHVVVRELAAAELVALERDPDSARDKLIHTTPAGRRRRRRVIDALQTLDERAARELGEAELRQLRALLVRLTSIPGVQGVAHGVGGVEVQVVTGVGGRPGWWGGVRGWAWCPWRGVRRGAGCRVR